MSNEKKHPKVIKAEKALERDIAQVRMAHGLDVKYSISVRGGPSLYSLTDLDDGMGVGVVELRRSDYYPGNDKWLYHRGDLQAMIQEMLQTPRVQLKRLVLSDEALYSDIESLEQELGVHCYKPNALPLNVRIPNGEKQILYATTDFFKGTFFSSSESIGTVQVNTSEFVPGRHSYPERSMYRTGDLKKEFIQDPKLVLAYVGRVLNNAKNFWPGNRLSKVNWAKKAADLTQDFANVFEAARK